MYCTVTETSCCYFTVPNFLPTSNQPVRTVTRDRLSLGQPAHMSPMPKRCWFHVIRASSQSCAALPLIGLAERGRRFLSGDRGLDTMYIIVGRFQRGGPFCHVQKAASRKFEQESFHSTDTHGGGAKGRGKNMKTVKNGVTLRTTGCQ